MRAIVEIHLEELEVADQQGHLTFEYYEGAKWALKRVLSELDKNDEEMMMDMMLNDYSQQMADKDQRAADKQIEEPEWYEGHYNEDGDWVEGYFK